MTKSCPPPRGGGIFTASMLLSNNLDSNIEAVRAESLYFKRFGRYLNKMVNFVDEHLN